MLNTRKGSTPLSYAIQPGAQYLYDHVARRVIRYVETVVPTINPGDAQAAPYIPADRYYANIGAMQSGSNLPSWTSAVSNVSFLNWDTTARQFYARLSSAAALGSIGANQNARVIYPSGVFGEAASYAPKNASVAAVLIKFKARFNANADYGVYGVGGVSQGNRFDTATDHFIQVTRNAGNWELGSCDGSTISQSASSAGADGGWHEFVVRWELGVDLKLYVDEVLVITKTANLPAQPLQMVIYAENATNTIDIVDYLVEWELA